MGLWKFSDPKCSVHWKQGFLLWSFVHSRFCQLTSYLVNSSFFSWWHQYFRSEKKLLPWIRGSNFFSWLHFLSSYLISFPSFFNFLPSFLTFLPFLSSLYWCHYSPAPPFSIPSLSLSFHLFLPALFFLHLSSLLHLSFPRFKNCYLLIFMFQWVVFVLDLCTWINGPWVSEAMTLLFCIRRFDCIPCKYKSTWT